MALFRSCSVHREAELLLKSSPSIFPASCLVFSSSDHLFTMFKLWRNSGDTILLPPPLPPSPIPTPTTHHYSPTFNLMVARPSLGPVPGCGSPRAVKLIASQDWSVCLHPDLVCRREQRGPYRAPQGGLVPSSQWLRLLAGRLEEGLLWPQWWVTAQAGADQAHTPHTTPPSAP